MKALLIVLLVSVFCVGCPLLDNPLKEVIIDYKKIIVSLCNTVETKDETIIILTQSIDKLTADKEMRRITEKMREGSRDSIKNMVKLRETVKP